MVPLLVVVGLLLLVAIIVFGSRASFKVTQDRCERIREFGQELGLTMLDPLASDSTAWKQIRPASTVVLRSKYPDLFLFTMPACSTCNVLEGDQRGRLVRSFDLSYTISTGKGSYTTSYGVVSVSIGKPVPVVDIRYESLWDKVKGMFAKVDLLVDNPDFDKKYLVHSADEPFARALLDTGIQEEMLSEPFDGHLLTADSAVVYVLGTCEGDQLRRLLERAHRLAERAALQTLSG